MSGIDLLLETSIDYERTHQIVLYTLLSQSTFAEYLAGIKNPAHIKWEPENQLFDLAVQGNNDLSTYIEIKMWSTLNDSQIKKQVKFLQENQHRGVYILLGTSFFERTDKNISNTSKGIAKKVGYDRLIAALNKILTASGEKQELYELALAYRNVVQDQYEKLLSSYKSSNKDKAYYYSLYYEIQKRIRDIETAIYTVNNQGGPVYILNSQDHWLTFEYKNTPGDLYYEVVNGTLCIKLRVETEDEDIKRKLRDRLRESVKKVFRSKYKLIDSGRMGKNMTICKIDHDFTDIDKIEESAKIFMDIGGSLGRVIEDFKNL